MLRVPGTTNYKPKYGPDFPEVTVIHADFETLYTLADFESELPAAEEKPEREAVVYIRPTSAAGNDREIRYWLTALENQTATLAAATKGNRNVQLHRSARALGQLIGAGMGDQGEAYQPLFNTARSIGLEERDINASIRSGMTWGIAHPATNLPNFDHPVSSDLDYRKDADFRFSQAIFSSSPVGDISLYENTVTGTVGVQNVISLYKKYVAK